MRHFSASRQEPVRTEPGQSFRLERTLARILAPRPLTRRRSSSDTKGRCLMMPSANFRESPFTAANSSTPAVLTATCFALASPDVLAREAAATAFATSGADAFAVTGAASLATIAAGTLATTEADVFADIGATGFG